jgi:hypothetical protein
VLRKGENVEEGIEYHLSITTCTLNRPLKNGTVCFIWDSCLTWNYGETLPLQPAAFTISTQPVPEQEFRLEKRPLIIKRVRMYGSE